MLTGGAQRIDVTVHAFDLEKAVHSTSMKGLNYLRGVREDYKLWARSQKAFDAGEELVLSFNEKIRLGRTISECTNVYFVLDDKVPRIKIGRSKDVGRRLSGLRAEHGKHLNVITAVRCPPGIETYLHDLLAAHCVGGEWFAPEEAVLQVVDAAAESGLAGIIAHAILIEERCLTREP